MSEPSRRNRNKGVIRQLRDDEPVPTSKPRKYKNASGYVRLRWLIGTEQYVEAYEHRINAGRPPEPLQVHHLNHIRDDNRPENLVVLSPEDHARLHVAQQGNDWDLNKELRQGYRCVGSYQKATRHAKREAGRKAVYMDMRRLYEMGMSTTQIGRKFLIDPSNVSIHLRQVGTKMRPSGRNQ